MTSPENQSSAPQRVRIAVLFTDLQGSTRWLYDMGPHVVFRALEDHFSLLDKAFRGHAGKLIKRTGDGVMAVFPSLEAAIRGAVDAQQLLYKARTDGAKPLKIPPMRVGISAGETYHVISPTGEDYFGRVCAEASRILDLAQGHHIMVAADSLSQEEFGRDALKADGVSFTKTIRVFRKGLDEVPVCEILWRPCVLKPTDDCIGPPTSQNGLIVPQSISRSRPDLAPFSYFENSVKAHSDIDEFLLSSNTLDFLHIRGIVAGSSSPFNSFAKLMADGAFTHPVKQVRVGILHPSSDWIGRYYTDERGLDRNTTNARVEECTTAASLAATKLRRFQLEGRLESWTIFFYKQTPIWRLLITEKGVVATPYGGKGRTVDSIVLFADTIEHPIYQSFKRYFAALYQESEVMESVGIT